MNALLIHLAQELEDRTASARATRKIMRIKRTEQADPKKKNRACEAKTKIAEQGNLDLTTPKQNGENT
jgi:hypothetical protein